MCRLMIFDQNGFVIPNTSINASLSSKFTVDIFNDRSKVFIGLSSEDDKKVIDLFGVTDISHRQTAINVNGPLIIHSPLNSSSLAFMISELPFEKFQNFQFSTCFGINVVQDLGILTYELNDEVGLVIGQYPISSDRNRFSIEIINAGQYGRITIGLVPANYPIFQPGWGKHSYAYHGDDGGIYTGEATAGDLKEAFSEIGNRIEVIVEHTATDRYVTWQKNGKVIERIPIKFKENLYPAIGLHSIFEQVKLLDSTVWKSNESLLNDKRYGGPKQELIVDPIQFLPMKNIDNPFGICHIIPGNLKIKKIEITISYKNEYLDFLDFNFDSFNDLKNVSKTKENYVFENVSKSGLKLLTFKFQIFSSVRQINLRDYILNMNIISSLRETIQKQWELIDVNEYGPGTELILEVPNKHVVPTRPSLLLTTYYSTKEVVSDDAKYSAIEEINMIRYYHIPKKNYRLIFKANKSDAYIRCSDFFKPNFTRSFQIGNIISYNSKPAVVVYSNKSNNEIKITGHTETIQFKNISIKPLMIPGKSLLALKPTEDGKLKKFSIINKSLLVVPPPSRPWLLAFHLENTDKISIPGLYFANECSEYHAMTICLLNLISSSEEDVKKIEKSYFNIALPFNQPNRDISHFLWEHSLMDLIHWENILFYPLCAKSFSLNDVKLHLLDIEGVQPFQQASPSDSFKAIFLNSKLLHTHKIFVNTKLLLPQYNKILQKQRTRFSETQLELFIFSVLTKLTNYMVLTNLLCEQKHIFNDILDINWDTIIEDGKIPGLNKTPEGISCKLHSLNSREINLNELINNQVSSSETDGENSLINNFIFQYAKCSQSAIFTGENMKQLPEELFDKFSNLKSLELRNMLQLESLPQTIYNLKGLLQLTINQINLRSLPEIWKFPNLKILHINQCPISNYKDEEGYKRLEDIKLQSLPLTAFPKYFCYQDNLVSLEIKLLGLETLPEEFKNLVNLKDLKILGSSLYYEIAKNDLYFMRKRNLQFCYPEINIYNVFNKDTTNLQYLPASEVFINVPRIGSGYSKSADILNQGGFPPVIMQLPSLRNLTMHYHSLRYVPETIKNLRNLKNLDLSFNPLLQRLPGEISLINSIKKVTLMHCPSLTVPPLEVVNRGSSNILAYLKYLLAQNVVCNRTKLMFVGLGEAGKTSLLHALISNNDSAKDMIQNEQKVVTDGIDIIKWTLISEEETIHFSTWDFAGQDVYYNTHQFFLSSKAIYIVVWSVRQGIEHGDLEFWLSSISCHAKDAPVFVVGTRCDQVQADISCFSSIKQKYPQIIDFKLVDSYSGTGIADLRDSLAKVTLSLPYMHLAVPSTFLELEKKIIEQRASKNYMTFEDFEKIALSDGIFKKDVKNVMQVLHDFGSIQYFDTELLKNLVVINPQWIVDIMANVVSVVNQEIKNGIFYHHDMIKVWKDLDNELHGWMLNLTEEFDLTFPHPTKEPKANIVPCLLSEEEPEIKWPKYSNNSTWKYYQIYYNFEFLPAGLFNRIQVRLFDFTETKEIWKFGTYFIKNDHHLLLKREKKNMLTIRALGVRPVNVLAMIDDVIKGLVKTSFHGVMYNIEISCPDCVEYGTNISAKAINYWNEVSMIPLKTVKKALMKKVEYLQCSELHLNSITSMKENTPEAASAEEFIEDLRSKVQTVRTLYASTEKYIIMLYSEEDFKGTSLLSMSVFDKMFDELKIKCFKLSELVDIGWKRAVLNSHLCLLILSDSFIKISKFNEILDYIIWMKKRFILFIANTDKDVKRTWDYYPYFQSVYIRIKDTDDKKIYNKKFRDLKNSICRSVDEFTNDQTGSDSYDCFISYCWSNSQDAVNKGTKSIPGAIVCSEADPRRLCKYLSGNGINCWIDESNISNTIGLNKQLSRNLRISKIMIAFVSNEYNNSENCKMELNFMFEELRRPIIFVLIGSNSDWRFDSEISLMMHKKNKSNILDFSSQALVKEEHLLNMVKKILDSDECKEVVIKKESTLDTTNTSTALIEQMELISRQFLNQLAVSIQEYCPRLVLLDIERSEVPNVEIEAGISEGKDSALKDTVTVDILFMKVICESEDNWHIVDDKYAISLEDKDALIENCAVYLYMIYQVLEYKNPGLKCLQQENIGKSELIAKIKQMAKFSKMSFKESYSNMIKYYMKYDSDLCQCSLKRYRFPSGRELWMCSKDADSYPRCKCIERHAATIDSTIVSVDEYDNLLLTDIKAKSGQETLKYSDSFRSIMNMWKTSDIDKIHFPNQPSTILRRPSIRHLRSDTLLNYERDIITNLSETIITPIRPKSSLKSKPTQKLDSNNLLNKRNSLVNRRNSMGSRVCSIQ